MRQLGTRPLSPAGAVNIIMPFMDEPSSQPPVAAAAPTEEAEVRRSQSRLIGAAGAWSFWANTSMGGVHRLFVMSLGGGAFHMGILEAVIQGGVLGQLAGLKLLRRLGKTRLVATGRLVSTLPAAGLLVLALTGLIGPWAIGLAIAAYAIMNLLYGVGSTAWWPLIQDNTSEGERGNFFARIRTRLRAIDVLVPILVGLYLGGTPSAGRFALPFLVALASLFVAAMLVRKIRYQPSAEPDVPLLLRLRLAGRSASVRRCLFYIFLQMFTLGLTLPLWQYMLKKHRGMPDAFVVWLTAVAAIGHLAGLRLWAWMVDTHGNRSVTTLGIVGTAALGAGWLLMPGGGWGVLVWAIAFYLLYGFLEGGTMMSRSTAMLAAVPAVYQADGLTLMMLSFSAGASLGGLIGGAVLDQIATWFPSSAWPDPKALYLAAAQGLVLFSLIPGRRLIGHARQTPAREIAAFLWRRVTGKEEPD